MPWEKTFDLDDAIDRATDVFWAKGYEATSLADLLKAIGINKGSFYNAFGSKKKIFMQSLLKYEREQRRDTLAELASLKDPVSAINKLFDALIEQSLTDKDKKGCFLVNTALDLPNHDSDIEKAVKKGLKDTESFFEQQITLGIQTGAIPEHVDPEVDAKGLLTLLVGLRVLARGVFDQNSLSAIKTQAIGLIQ
ncbi:TetR/AcrR family transcriptional regulator [Marinagarivorans cellulosilyticus]|uniref:TetR/AcrR family transcriptional regulator, transcriptional repressor for nem operon n=1 Tax=Marinagarivorans cellulosilyticus TaxID=2721545 RepID=A0AAN2BIG6_9GAMM|nr:TetR/AcrR family transcriptional regulator [Marinagarivorans cellulosilyticus]BCD95851.1 TetR/AcrR family transcriptional regulator, transcriptional repressor for nem operon [Marinagarivorans cellulosilyticus]